MRVVVTTTRTQASTHHGRDAAPRHGAAAESHGRRGLQMAASVAASADLNKGGAAALLLLLGLVVELQLADHVLDVVSVVHDGVAHMMEAI